MTGTKNCIHCLEPAVVWAGYVKAPRVDILAGWCQSCNRIDEAGNLPGFHGRYTTKLGRLDEATQTGGKDG